MDTSEHNNYAAMNPSARANHLTDSTFVSCAVQAIDDISSSECARILVVPAGKFSLNDGRKPSQGDQFELTPEMGHKIASQINTRRIKMQIDYSHQSLKAMEKAGPVPAAGWVTKAEYVPGEGLFLHVDWTEKAAAAIKDKEYRYISPVLLHDRQGNVMGVVNAALVNDPAMSMLPEVKAASLDLSPFLNEENVMKTEEVLQKLCSIFGIKDDAKNEDLIAAAETSVAQNQTPACVDVDLSQYVPIETFEGIKKQVAELQMAARERTAKELVTAAMDAGKLVPAQEGWALALCQKDQQAFEEYMSKTPAIAALARLQTGGVAPPEDGENHGLTDDELAICANTGTSPEAFATTKAGKPLPLKNDSQPAQAA